MTMQETLQYQIDKKKLQVAEWTKVIETVGECKGLTELEFEEASKISRIKSRTHVTHSKNALWAYKNTDSREQFKK